MEALTLFMMIFIIVVLTLVFMSQKGRNIQPIEEKQNTSVQVTTVNPLNNYIYTQPWRNRYLSYQYDFPYQYNTSYGFPYQYGWLDDYPSYYRASYSSGYTGRNLSHKRSNSFKRSRRSNSFKRSRRNSKKSSRRNSKKK